MTVQPITQHDPAAQINALIDAGLNLSDVIKAYAARNDDDSKRFIQLAREQWQKDGEVEIDDDTITSGSTDHGDYVLAWVWVDDPEPEDDEEITEGSYTFEADYGVHVNGDGEATISARNLEVGDTFNDPAYDAPGEWHTIDQLWMNDSTVHIEIEDE